MLKGNLSLAVCLGLGSLAAFGQSSFVFQVPGASGTSTQIVGFGDNDFSRSASSANAPAGTFQVLARPTGDKFFIVSQNAIKSAPSNATLSPLAAVSGITGTITTAGITPDGKYLLVIADHFYVIDAATNGILQTDLGIPSGSTPVGFAVSRDSKTVWVLSNVSSGSALGALSLTTFTQPTQFLYLPYPATSLTLSPLGLLYVTFSGAQLYEIDPSSLSVTSSGQINLPGLSGPLHFTPDGTAAYSVNKNVCPTCFSIFRFNSASHSVDGWPAPDPNNPPPTFDDVFVAGSSQIYAFSSTYPTTKLWDVSASPLSAAPSALGNFPNGPGLPINNIVAVAMSNERPAARFLYLLISDSRIMRVNVAGSNIDQQTSIGLQNGTGLSFTPIPAQSGAASVFALNRNLNVAPGATSAPLIGQVIDSVGRPVNGVPVCFSADPNSGLTVSAPSQVTNADGWVQTTIVAPATAGPYNVTLGVGAACPNPGSLFSTTFTINVGGSTTGSSQFSIYAGNGQLLRQFNSTTQTEPLTVKITNTDGTPVVGAPVTWAVTQFTHLLTPGGQVSALDSVSDENGLARATFLTGQVDQSFAFGTTTITATSDYGSVEFTETTHNATGADGDPGNPRVLILRPENQQLTVAQGSVVTDAILAKTTSGHFPQAGVVIPKIGIRLAASNISDNSPVAACQGSSLGGEDGISHCNVVAACQAPGTLPQTFPVVAAVGEYAFYPILVTVTSGSPSLLSIVSGNNQTGNPGTAFTLIAKVSDGCGQNASGVNVNWTVTQGTASLSQVQTVTSSNGSASARVTLGQSAGPIQVTVSSTGIPSVVFNLTNQIPVGGISLVSGGGQSANINSAFAAPVVFVVRDTNGNPVPGLVINMSVTGSATINPTSATSNAQGQVQTTVTAGATPDTIHVTAGYNTLFATAVLSSHLPGPEVTNNSFRNAASLAVGLVPCGLITVTGNGLAPSVVGVVSGLSAFGPLPYTLAGVSITVNNIPAPIQAVANQNGVQQANFQAPCELTAGTATVVVTVNGASATVSGVPVLAVQPGIFTYPGPNNKPYGAVIRASDGSYLTPSNPARRGDRLYMVVTGLGQVTPAALTNSAGTGSQNVNLPIAVGINDRGVPVLSARYLFGSIGAYLIEFTVPEDATLGNEQDLLIAALVNGTTYVFGNVAYIPGVVAGP